MRLRGPTLIGQNTGQARCRAQFERSRSLPPGNGDRPLVPGNRRRRWSVAGEQVAEQAMDFRFSPWFAGFSHYPKRFLECVTGEVRLDASGIGVGKERQANRTEYPRARS